MCGFAAAAVFVGSVVKSAGNVNKCAVEIYPKP